MELFRGALRAVFENVNCLAIDWKLTEQLGDPQEFLLCQEKSDIESRLWGFINVRLFWIEGTNDLLMDTLGLAALGLPDLQCHFRGWRLTISPGSCGTRRSTYTNMVT